jgi:hypothetical protein
MIEKGNHETGKLENRGNDQYGTQELRKGN